MPSHWFIRCVTGILCIDDSRHFLHHIHNKIGITDFMVKPIGNML